MKKRANIFEQSVFVGFSLKKKFLLSAYVFVLLHTIKDFFQDFLETDFLYFFDANENLTSLPQWSRVVLVLFNEAAVWVGIGLLVITPFVLKKYLPRLEKLVIAAYIFFFDKSTRTTAPEMKANYSEILRQGPF